MKKYILDAQRKFEVFKHNERLTGYCISQNHGDIKLEEKWLLYPVGGGTPETYYLQASKVHHTVHVRKPNGVLISITELY